jgi:hypothetical protein
MYVFETRLHQSVIEPLRVFYLELHIRISGANMITKKLKFYSIIKL